MSLSQSCQTLLKPDGSGVFIVRIIPDYISPTPFLRDPNGHPLRPLDYSVVPTGTVIPQVRWSPKNVNDHRQHVAEATLQMPIYFVQQDGVLGLSLDDAINGRSICQILRDPGMPAQLGGKTTTYIRIRACSLWPASYLCVESTYDDARCISVAWVQRIQAPSPDQRRDTHQKSDHRRKVCPSHWPLCGGLHSGQFLGVDL